MMAMTGGKVVWAFLVALFILESHSFRIDSNKNSNDQDSICAKRCQDTGDLINYQTGHTYTYQIELTTKLSQRNKDQLNTYYQQQKQKENTNVQIRALADLSVYQPCEMVLRVRQTQISGIEDDEQVNQMKAQLERQSTHFAYENGRVGSVCSEESEAEWTTNIKKSILSAIQMSAESIDKESSILETDVNGQCQTEYRPVREWKHSEKTFTVVKTKQLDKCNKRHQINVGFFPRSYGLDQVIRSSMPIVNATYECEQKVQDGIVVDAKCCDKQTIWPLNVIIDSDIRAQLVDQQQQLSAPKASGSFRRQNLAWTSYRNQQKEINDQTYSQQDVEQLLQQICTQVQDSVQLEVPQLFSQLVQAKQSLSNEEEQQIYESVRSGRACSSPKIVDIYLDASALAGTEGSVQVLIDEYTRQQQQRNQNQHSTENQFQQYEPQRFSYLFSLLAFSKHPTIEAAQRLVNFLQEQQQYNDYEKVVFGVTGYVHNLRQYTQDQQEHSNPNRDENQNRDSKPSPQEVESIVLTVQQHLIDQLEKCVQQNSNVQVTKCLTIVHGIKNTGVQTNAYQQEQNSNVQRLIQLVEQTNGQNNQDQHTSIRAAILRSIVDAVNNEHREYLIEKFFKNDQEPTLVRLEAYKTTVMSGAKISHLEDIRNYVDSLDERTNKDLVNYVRSHQANLRTTSDLHRRTVLPLGSPEFRKPNAVYGTSRNYELSYLNDAYQIGVTAEADVIYNNQQQNYGKQKQSFLTIPQSITFNVTVPVMGKEFQAVEIRVHQTGFDEMLADQMELENRANHKTDPMAVLKKLIEIISQKGQQWQNNESNQQYNVIVQVSVDGKTVFVADQHDLYDCFSDNGQIRKFFYDLFNNGQQQVSVDRAYSFIPVDFVARMTTSNGFPVQVQLNSSIVVGLKTEATVNLNDNDNDNSVQFALWPSLAGQVDAKAQYYIGNQAKSIKHVARIYSAPHVNLMAQFNDQQSFNIKWTMPKSRYTLFRYESSFSTNDQSNNPHQHDYHSDDNDNHSGSNSNYHKHQCTDFTKKPLGIALCYDVSYQNGAEQSEFVSEVTIEKFDRQLNVFEICMDNPLPTIRSLTGNADKNYRKQQQKRSLKIIFNTPGSQVDRELAFELDWPTLEQSLRLGQKAGLRLKTPWKEITAQAIVQNNEQQRRASVELSMDNKKYLAIEMGLELMKRGEKSEYRCKMILSSPIMRRPVNLMGIWSYQTGQKTVLFVSLEDVEQGHHYIQTTLVKSGKFSEGDLKSSLHCAVDLASVSAKAHGTIERSSTDLKLDFNTDYSIRSQQPQSARLAFRHQNKSQGKMTKFVNQGAWQWSKYPQYDIAYNHYMTYTLNNYLEHNFQLGWANQEEQIRAYQEVKVNEQRGKYDIESRCILVAQPLKINYQLNTQAVLVGLGTNSQKRYQLIATGHDNENQKDLRAEVSFDQQHEPMKMTVRASMKSESIDFKYSDDIEEQKPNTYNGHMKIQLSPEKKYSTDYVYSIEKFSNDEYKHKMEAVINDDNSQRLFGKHQGEVRIIGNKLFEVKSKYTKNNDESVFDGELKLNRHGLSSCQFQHYPSNTEAKAQFDTQQMTGEIEFQKDDLKHSSSVKCNSWKSFELNSKTKRNHENILSIDSQINSEDESHVNVDSNPFTSEIRCNPNGDYKSAKLQFRIPKSWAHESKIMLKPNDYKYEVDSHTDYKDQTIADINGKYHHDNEYKFKVKLPKISTGFSADINDKKYEIEFDNNKYNHYSKLNCEPESIILESNTKKNGKNVASINYNCGPNRIHKLKLGSDDLINAQAECNLDSNEPHANVDLSWQGESPVEHQTRICGNRQQQSINVDSRTKLSDDKISRIRAAIAKNPADKRPYGNMEIDTPQFEADIDYKQPNQDEQQLSFGYEDKFSNLNLKHRTQMKIKRSIVDLKSESKCKTDGSNYLNVNGQYRHNDQHQPSQFDVKVGQIFQTLAKFNLFNKQEKNIEMKGKYNDNRGIEYQHETSAQYWPSDSSMKIDSQIKNEYGQKIAQIKSFLSANAEIDSEHKQEIPKAKVEINPRMKRAAIDFDNGNIKHQSSYQDDNTAMKINTLTTKNQQNVFNFNTEINRQPNGKSHMNAEVGPHYRTSFHVYPEQQSGMFSFQTPSTKHSTEIDVNQQQYGHPTTIHSNTQYNDNLLADIDARLEGLRGENVIRANVPSYIRLDTTVDVPGKRISFDAQSDRIDRHAMGSFYANRRNYQDSEGREFHFDLAWDVDRDPRSRVSVDVNAKRQSDQTVKIEARADYAQNKLNFDADFTPKKFMANSARVGVSYVPYGNDDSWQVVYTHLNHVPQIECKLEFLFRGQLKYSTRFTSQVTDDRFAFGFQTNSPQNVDAQVNLNVLGVSQGQGQYYAKATFQRAVEDQYEIEATSNQDPEYQVYFGKVDVHLPRTETQTVEYRVDLPGRRVNVHMVNPQTGKQFKIEGEIDEQHAQLVIKSDIHYFPVIDGKIRYVPYEEFYTKLDVDNERLFYGQCTLKGFNLIEFGGFQFLVKGQSAWTPSFEVTAQTSQQDNEGLTFTVEGKYNAEKIFYGQIRKMLQSNNTNRQAAAFDMEGWVSRPNGVKLIQTVSKFVVGGEDEDLVEYILNIEPNRNELETIEPIYVIFTGQRKPGNSNKMVGSVKVSHGHERRDWIDADLVVESIHRVYNIPIPERTMVTVRYVPTSTQATFEVSLMERLNEDTYGLREQTLFDTQNIQPQLNNLRIVGKYRNQFVATVDDRKAGFEIVSTQLGSRNTYEHKLKLYSPKSSGHQLQYRVAHHFAPETLTYFHKSELKSGYEQNEPIYQSTSVFAPIPDKPTSYLAYYDLKSPLLSGDSHVSSRVYVFGPENRYQGVVATFKNTQNDQVTFEATARTEDSSVNQLSYYGQSNRITYFNASLYSHDHRIDTGVNGQVSSNGATFNWHNQNRNGHLRTGSYRFYLIGNNQFEAGIEHEHYGYNAKGEFRNKQGSFTTDILVDEYKKSYGHGYYYGAGQQEQRQTQKQYKIHVEAKDKCVRAEIENQHQQQHNQQMSLCMDMDQSNILNVAADSIENGQKTTDLNIRLDTREVVNSAVLSVRWNPKYYQTFLGQILNEITSHYNPSEVSNELHHMVGVLKQTFGQNGRQASSYQAFAEQLAQIAEDFGIDTNQIKQNYQEFIAEPTAYHFQKVAQAIYNYFFIGSQAYEYFGKLVRNAEYECYNSELCRNVVKNLANFDSVEKVYDFVADQVVNTLQHAHRIISTSYAGRLVRGLIPSTLLNHLPQFIHQANYYLVNAYTKIVHGNYPLAELIDNIEHILHQMLESTHWLNVEWNQVKKSVGKVVQMTLSPTQYATTSRVLIYDPTEGKFQIELYGPAVQHPRYYQSKYNDLFGKSSAPSSGHQQYYTNNSRYSSSTNNASGSFWPDVFGSVGKSNL